MTTQSIDALVVQKVRTVLAAVADVSKYVGSRIYVSHISTIRDAVFPACSIHILSGSTDIDGPFGETTDLQIDFWFAVGKDQATWDNVMECVEAAIVALNRAGLWDNSLGIKIFESRCLQKGPQMVERDGALIHYPTRWTFRAAL